MHAARQGHRQRQRGIGVVEAMVGIVVGMVVTLVIYQMFVGFETQRRVTVGMAAAQQSGAYALSVLGRAVGMAGWGTVSTDGLTCNNARTWDAVADAARPAGLSMQPVVILKGAAGLSDTVIVNSGTALRGGAPMALKAKMTAPLSPLQLASTTGYLPGDLVWVLEGANCTLMEISSTDAIQGLLHHDAGSNWHYNPNAAAATGWPLYTTAARVYGLGRAISNRYRVVNGDLVVNDITSVTSSLIDEVVASNVVQLRAQYGLSDLRSTRPITQWADGGEVAGLDAARIRAVRISVLVRADEAQRIERETGKCPSQSAPKTWTDGPDFDLSAIPDWTCYRYRVHQTVIPMRNVLLAF